jgi:hypothetical protein
MTVSAWLWRLWLSVTCVAPSIALSNRLELALNIMLHVSSRTIPTITAVPGPGTVQYALL